ncbi:MAG TPA: 2-amino-4-hydroxy-6-hydroxymethyldihydropteridine diphosphokinase [Bacteroidia bacterium]|jgi:deoxyguanosine kinase|nr:2-amino-4-hydroxy-6-hydroxymethyldihydropteridine diphosphokinase [Bacteroidia bacterium]
MNEVYLCLGGNLGNCLVTFEQVCTLIEQTVGKVKKQSSLYQSQAWGMEGAPDFLNQVIMVETKISEEELLIFLLEIEKKLGRERTETTMYQSRLIDIDVLFFNKKIIKTKTLEIPHPRLYLRKFVLEPLNEIAPNFIHPVLNKSISELLKLCPDTGQVKKLSHVI